MPPDGWRRGMGREQTHPVAFDRAFHPTAVSRSRSEHVDRGYADAMSTDVTVSTGPPQTTGVPEASGSAPDKP